MSYLFETSWTRKRELAEMSNQVEQLNQLADTRQVDFHKFDKSISAAKQERM
jgi:hypothetical protein